MSFNPQNVPNSVFGVDIKCFRSTSHMCQYPICSNCSFDYCSLTNTRYFTRFGEIYVLLSYRTSIPRSSSGAHNGAKISICIITRSLKVLRPPTRVWMGLPVSRVSDAGSLGICLPRLREVV